MPDVSPNSERRLRLSVLNPLRWRKSFLLSVFVVFALLWFGFVDRYSLYARYQISQEKEAIEQRIERLRKETSRLEIKIESIREHPVYFERIAREEYGMRRQAEVVYRIDEDAL